MKDLPVFTCEHGVATLILREIPYKRNAYVLIRSYRPGSLRALMEESRQFCVLAGAERVSVSSDEPLENLKHLHDLAEMRCRRDGLPALEEPVELEAVTEKNGKAFLEIYNRLFFSIPNAVTYTRQDLERVLRERSAFLAVVDGRPAGIGEWRGGELAVIGVLPAFRGLGGRLTLSVIGRMTAVDEVKLHVSTANLPAMKLYRRLGFVQTRVLSRWYAL